jgi:NAD(P)-dependent dehydrogenase (short-subunit alcohol dehydrogenase family)
VTLARHGVAVAIAARTLAANGRTPGALVDTEQEITAASGSVLSIQADMTQLPDIQNLVSATLERFGRLDILINNAADTTGCAGPVEDMPDGFWHAHFDVNVIQLAVAQMKAQGHGGTIVNMASVAGQIADPPGSGADALLQRLGLVAYASSKAALIRLSNALAPELALHDITIACVDPGFTRTEKVDAMAAKGLVDPAYAHSMEEPVARVLQILQSRDPSVYAGRILQTTASFEP